ncbi:aspartyl protease family protein [Mesorhizobium soli]|jgi:aspartyl protease family protein|uniref:retropepsin-like aspartic protease family protein n=1 Tax=Pseudaminobacter soli (ex Li et al. 2025) TaxID=1295366 RepID=UPI0024731514|nr:TIGR02281 family clan AA aspartic protease [Mesorhizobium soli]MDH6229580.1 aspartyl protease family protein [Mesorhizobium soli]
MAGRGIWIVLAVMGIGLLLLLVNDMSGDASGISSNTMGRVLYLGIFGAVIGAGILNARHHFGDIVRNLGLWLLLVLVLIAGYQYRYELQDVANRVTAGLVPGSPLSLTDSEGRSTVTLEKSPNGHFEARLNINGAPVRALVDTGATATVLTAADAERAGFNPSDLDFTIPVSTANGDATAARVVARNIELGAISRRNQTVLVAAPGMLSQSLLGMNFLSSLSGFDIRGDRMILRD